MRSKQHLNLKFHNIFSYQCQLLTTLTGVHAAVSRVLDMGIARKTIQMAKENFVTLTCQRLVLMPNQVLTFKESSYPGKLVSVKDLRSAPISLLLNVCFKDIESITICTLP